jgi:hypothetical protein
MNAKQIFAALSIALAGNVAMAVEADQFNAPDASAARADVKAEITRNRNDVVLMSGGEATVFVDRPVASTSRDTVRAEARAAARNLAFNELYAG